MLKDITLGQYFPGKSAVHRLDPRVKLVLTVAFIVVLFLCKGALSYGILGLLVLTAVWVSKISFKLIFKGVRPILILLIFTTIFNIFYTTSGTVLLHWGFLTITTGGLITALYMIIRIVLLIIGTFVMLTYTTSPIALTDGIESVLSPLKKIRVPVHELAMMMTIALRFIPTLTEETDKIISAQKSRGADFDSGNLLRRAKALIPVLVPLFVSAFRRAEELAVAMECRCYRGDVGRTRLRVLKTGRVDYITLGLCVIVFGLAIYFSFFLPVGVAV